MEKLANKLKEKKMHKTILIIAFLFGSTYLSKAQVTLNKSLETISYSSPRQYVLGGVNISGTKYLDHKTLIQISGLEIGKTITIPGDDLTKSIEKLWEQGLFSDIQISAEKSWETASF